MEKSFHKENAIFKHNIKILASIFVVVSLILTSTLSVIIVKSNYDIKDDNAKGVMKYSYTDFSYNTNSDISKTVNFDNNIDSFDLLPEEGQNRILGGKENLKNLREQTIKRIQEVKIRLLNILGEKHSFFSSNFPILSRLFGKSDSENVVESSYVPCEEKSDNTAVISQQYTSSIQLDALGTTEGNGNSNGSTDNITVIPESGHIIFIGEGSMDLNMVLDINGTIVTIVGMLNIGPGVGSVEIWWNLSEGYFEITGDGYFEFTDLYLNIDDGVVFVTSSLVLDAYGHIMINHNGFEGDLYLDGVLELTGLSFDINLENILGYNVSVSGSFDFSKFGEAEDLSISWGESGISASGNFVGSSELNIYNFNIKFNSIFINASLISLHKSTVLTFIENEDDGVVRCVITSTNLLIQDLYLGFGENGLFVDSIVVNGSVQFLLEIIDPEQYITKEEGHIGIGGCFALSVDTTINVNGTIVDISGTLKLDYGYLNIDWDKDEGFFKISSTCIIEIDDFSISIDGNWISLGWDNFIIYKDGYLLVEKTYDMNDSVQLVIDGCSEITGIYFNGEIGDFSIGLSVGSILFIEGSLFEVTMYNNTVVMDLDAALGYGLIIHDFDFEVMGFDIRISAIIVMGNWHLFYSDQTLVIKTEGFIEILNFSLGNVADGAVAPLLGAGYFRATGESEIQVLNNGTIIFAVYSVDSSLCIGSVPMVGYLALQLYGDAWLRIDLINRTIFGYVHGEGYITTGSVSLGAIVVSGISVMFDGEAYFSLVGTDFNMNMNFEASLNANLYVNLNAMFFNLHNFNLCAYGSINAYITGSISLGIDLATGESSISGCIFASVLVNIQGISGYGKGAWGNFDVNDDDRTDLYIKIDEISVDFTDTDINAWVGVVICIPSFSMGMSDFYVWGKTQGFAEIDGLHIRARSYDSPIPGELDIDYIWFDAELIIHPSVLLKDMHIEADAGLNIQGFEYKYRAGNASYPTTVTISFGEMIFESGHIDILLYDPMSINNSIQDLEVRIDGSGTYLDFSNFDIAGTIKLKTETSYNIITLSGHIDNIQFASETSSFSIYYGQKDTGHDEAIVVVVDGSDGLIHIDGVEGLGATVKDSKGNIIIAGSVDVGLIDLSLEGYLKVYQDGVIEVNCAGTFNLEDLTLDLGEISIQILIIDIFFGGEIIIYPGDENTDKPPVIDVEGQVNWDVNGDIETDGSIYVDGRITVDWEKDESGIWFVNIIFDSTDAEEYGIFIDYFSLNTIKAGFPIEVNIDNYWGTGMFEFSIDLHKSEIFMDNQVDGVWEDFSFDVGPISGKIYHFWGDIKLSNLQIYSEDMGIDWNMDSRHGYLTYIGFEFSTDSDDDFELIGDIGLGQLHITNLHLDAGTTGTFRIYEDASDPDVLHIRVNCDSGSAQIVGYLSKGEGSIRLWFSIDCENGNDIDLEMPNIERILQIVFSDINTLVEELSKLGTGQVDWQALGNAVDDILSALADLEGIKDTLGEHGEFLGLTVDDKGTTLADFYEKYKDQLPDWLREKIERILRSLEPITGNSCFLSGTKIEMYDGSLKNIEDIELGDQVASYNVETAEWTTGVVTEVFHHNPYEMTDYYLVLNNDLRITPNHPIMVDGVWILAGEIQIGDDFGGNIISTIDYVYERVPTYNFEVDIYHTYNVVWGESAKSIVHNAAVPTSDVNSLVQRAVTGTKNPCFLADTKISMANGSSKFIQDIEVGDKVLSYDIKNATWTNGTVVEVDHHTAQEMPAYYMVINNDLRVTPNHPVYVKSRNMYSPNPYGPDLPPLNEGSGQWIAAGTLQVGQELDGQVITSIRQVFHKVPTYNFKVEPYHNYRVLWGETNSIAHENESLLEREHGDIDPNCTAGHPDVNNPPLNPPNTTNAWGDKNQSCFLSGTKVEMFDGSIKNIEEIEVGDNVKSYDESTGEQKTGVVSKILHHLPNEMTQYYLIINNDLKITPNHPIMLDGVWIEAGDLKIGDNFGGNIIFSIEKVYSRVPTFNFEVEPYHTYNIVWGEKASSVVHNAAVPEENIRSIISDKKKNPCFLENTKIQMKDGSLKNIEEIEKGDIVKAFDTETKSWKNAEVIEVFHHDSEDMTDYYLIINDDLRITPNHPIYVNNEWIYAGELEVGDVFGGEIITSIQRVFEKEPTYNFDVDPYHTYNVVWGNNAESIVHNQDVAKKYVISGTKYGNVDIADSGLDAKFELYSLNQIETFEMVSKIYTNRHGETIVINNDDLILTDDGKFVENEKISGYSVNTVDESGDRSYNVDKYDTTVAEGLNSIQEVENYLRSNVVNTGTSGGSGSSNNSSCCFPAGTMISMADGTCKPIESINVGEEVLSYDTKLGVFVTNSVKEIVSPVREGAYSINDGLICPTDDHPFYTMKSDGKVDWAAIKPEKTLNGYQMKTMQLELGDRILTVDGSWIKIYSIEYQPGSIQTYNLEDVSGQSNFFANKILVHNAADCAQTTQQNTNTIRFSTLNFWGDGVDNPVDMTNGIPVQFITGDNFITFGNKGVSATTQIFVVNKMDIYPEGTFDRSFEDGLDAIPIPDPCCFPAGTKISMADGCIKNIEDIKIGDLVSSYDISKNIFVSRIVTNTIIKQREAIYSINDGLLMPTNDHPIYVKKVDGRVGWAAINPENSKVAYSSRAAMPLEIGDMLFTSNGWIMVESIKCKPGSIITYTFTVDELHNYFANSVLVSNEDACSHKIGGTQPIQLSTTDDSYPENVHLLIMPLVKTKDNIFYPAESITAGDIIRAYNPVSKQIVNAVVTNVSMSITEGKYVDIELMQYAEFQNYEQKINVLENYLQKSSSSGSTLTAPNVDPYKKIFFGIDQFVKTTDDYVKAQDLKIGDVLIGYNDNTISSNGNTQNLFVSSIQIKRRVIPVYNITLNNMPPEEDKDSTSPIKGLDGRSVVMSSSDPLRNYLSYINAQYDNSTHCYLADGIVISDYLAGTSSGAYVDTNTCFLGGTKIMMASSNQLSTAYYKNIEDVRAGDIVTSYDTVNNRIASSKVSNVSKHVSNEYLLITLSKSSTTRDSVSLSIFNYPKYIVNPTNYEQYYTLKTTSNHPIYVCTKNSGSLPTSISFSLKTAKTLSIGDLIFINNRQTATVTSIEKIVETVPTYNIELETYHNYFADYILVGEKQNFNQKSSDRTDNDVAVHSSIKITTLDEFDKSSHITDTICFGYYKEEEYTYEYGYFKENSALQKSTGRFGNILSNIMKKLLQRFPWLEKFKFFERYLENNADTINDPANNQDNEPEITPEDSQQDTSGGTEDDSNNVTDEIPTEQDTSTGDYEEDASDETQDDSNNVPDEIPTQQDTIPEEDDETQENNPEEPDQSNQDDSADDTLPILPPIQKPTATSLQSELLSIIDENRVDEYQQIHYIWDFGDGTYKYGKDVAHNYDLGYPEPSSGYDDYSYSGLSTSSEIINEIVTYLVTLIIVDDYGNIIDMDMTSVTIDLTWSSGPTGYSLVNYSLNF